MKIFDKLFVYFFIFLMSGIASPIDGYHANYIDKFASQSKYSEEYLEKECLSITTDMYISDADLIIKSSNRRTKTIFEKGGGHIKYWIWDIKKIKAIKVL